MSPVAVCHRTCPFKGIYAPDPDSGLPAPGAAAPAPAATTAAPAAPAEGSGDMAKAGENCMPPAMYFMELMTCNSKIDEETERLFPALFATFEEEERQKLEEKLNSLKAVRYWTEKRDAGAYW